MQSTAPSPLITIGITCFNAEDTIARAIQSAQNQDWPKFEIVIVDDASTDKSIGIIEKIQKEDGRISLHCHSKNQGLSAARNTIVRHAKGEYVAFFDDDDESLPSRLSKQYQRLSRFQQIHPDKPVLCYCHRHVFKDGPKNFYMAVGARPLEPYGEMVVDFLLWDKRRKGYDLCGDFGDGVMMASRTLLEKFPFDIQFRRGQDWDIAIRVAMKGGYFISVDEVLINQYVTETADKAEALVLGCLLMLLKKNKKYLQKKNMYYAAFFYLHTRFYRARRKLLRACFFLILACLLSPKEIVVGKIGGKLLRPILR